MCGILGFTGANTTANRELIKRLMILLSLRGTHSTGVSYAARNGLRTHSSPIGAEEFFETVHLDPREPIRMLGHTRYSTTGDLKWSQPLTTINNFAMVFNGVIDQRDSSHWPAEYRVHGAYLTTNDVEIAMNASAYYQARGKFGGSWAICEMDGAGVIYLYRNAYRPLWWGDGPDFKVCASTADVLLRCEVKNVIQVAPYMVYELSTGRLIQPINPPASDLQPTLANLFPDLQCLL